MEEIINRMSPETEAEMDAILYRSINDTLRGERPDEFNELRIIRDFLLVKHGCKNLPEVLLLRLRELDIMPSTIDFDDGLDYRRAHAKFPYPRIVKNLANAIVNKIVAIAVWLITHKIAVKDISGDVTDIGFILVDGRKIVYTDSLNFAFHSSNVNKAVNVPSDKHSNKKRKDADEKSEVIKTHFCPWL